MKRLEKDEKADRIRRLAQWQTPKEMHSEIKDLMSVLGASNLFNQSGLEFIRDAWITSEFGEIRKAKQVLLVSEDFPDFELKIGGRVEAFEAVEADDSERQRGVKYRDGIGKFEEDPVEDWIARAEQAPIWLEAACRRKVGKLYGVRVNLVIYLKLNEFGIRQAAVETCFPSATESAKEAFETVWVLWKNRSYPIWP